MSEWREKYHRALASKAWRDLRLAVVTKQGFRCGDCGMFGGVTRSVLELHHLHYDTLGAETTSDVIALCKVCHANADQERAKRGHHRAIQALWEARFMGWAESVGIDPDESAAERFEEWLERVEY